MSGSQTPTPATPPAALQVPGLHDGDSPESTSSRGSPYLGFSAQDQQVDIRVENRDNDRLSFHSFLGSSTLSLDKWQSVGLPAGLPAGLPGRLGQAEPSTPIHQMIPENLASMEKGFGSPDSDMFDSPEPELLALAPEDNVLLPVLCTPFKTIEGEIPMSISTSATSSVFVNEIIRTTQAKCSVRFQTGAGLFNTSSLELLNATVTDRTFIRMQSNMSAMIEGSLWFEAMPLLTVSHFYLEHLNFDGEIETLLDINLEDGQLRSVDLVGEFKDVLRLTYDTFDGMRTFHMTTGNRDLLHNWLTALHNPYVVVQAPVAGMLRPAAKLESVERRPIDIILCLPHYEFSDVGKEAFTGFIDAVLAKMGMFDTLGLVIYGMDKTVKTFRSRGPLAVEWEGHSWMRLLGAEVATPDVEHVRAAVNAAATMVGARNCDRKSTNKTVLFVSTVQFSGSTFIPAYLAGREAKMHGVCLGKRRPFATLKNNCHGTGGTYTTSQTVADACYKLGQLTVTERSYIHRQVRMVVRPARTTTVRNVEGAASFFALDNAAPDTPATIWVNMGTIYENSTRDVIMDMEVTVPQQQEGLLDIVDFHVSTDSSPADTIKNDTSIAAEVISRAGNFTGPGPLQPHLYTIPAAQYLPMIDTLPLYQDSGIPPEAWLDGMEPYPNQGSMDGGAWWTDPMLTGAEDYL